MLGDEDSFSTLFYLINRHFLYMLDNDPSISIKESDINFRRKFYHILKLVAPSMLACKQVIENREYNWEELEEIKDNLVIRGEISNMDKNENPTSLSDEYSSLVDKFIEFINKE